MRTAFDLSPLYRSSIGFDRVFNLLENANRLQAVETWPPYDIVRANEDAYRITVAVAGFSEGDLDITLEPNLLIVTGERKEEQGTEYLHRGLSPQRFTRRFELADHVKVSGASLSNGLLTIDLKREIPEEMKPRKIEIGASSALPKSETMQIEAEKQAA
jgi:molecular chaperone IbpA